jgi:predicted porin
MKKTILALAVVSIAAAATAEVKLSGRIGTQLGSYDAENTLTNYDSAGNQIGNAVVTEDVSSNFASKGTTDGTLARAKFYDAGSELNIDASEQIGSLTAYAHAELDFTGLNDNGLNTDEVRVGIKGAFGDLQLGDVASACDDLTVGGSYEVMRDDHAQDICRDGNSDSGIKYSGDFGAVKTAISFRPDVEANQDETSVAVQGTVGPVKASLAYTTRNGGMSNDFETATVGVLGSIAGAEVGLHYANYSGDGAEGDAIELNAAYNLPKGQIYAGYGTSDIDSTNSAGRVEGTTEKDGYMIGYKHNLSSRTIAWVEYAGLDTSATDTHYTNTADNATNTTNTGRTVSDTDASAWSVGLRHAF